MNHEALNHCNAPGKGKPAGKHHTRQTVRKEDRLLKSPLLRKLSLLMLTVLVILYAADTQAKTLRTVTATITKISDGDTVQAVTPEGTKLKVRLYGIDAPETQKGKIPGEPFGSDSRNHLATLVNQKTVRVEIRDIDRYRRMVAVLWLGERNVNQEMLSAGMAEAYVEHLKQPYRAPFLQAEQEAKSQGKGIWSQGSSYERPSQFRRRMGS